MDMSFLFIISILLLLLSISVYFNGLRSGIASNNNIISLLHPLVFPLVYIIFVLCGPLLYMWISGNEIGSVSTDVVSFGTINIAGIFIIGFALCSYLSTVSFRNKAINSINANDKPKSSAQAMLIAVTVRNAGRFLLVVALIGKLYVLMTKGSIWNSVYGADQLSYGSSAAIASLSEGLIAISCAAIMSGNVFLFKKPIRVFDLWLLLVVLSTSLFLMGNRGDTIGPIILLIWYVGLSGKKIRFAILISLTIAISYLFTFVASIRSQSDSADNLSLIERVLWDVSSPTKLSHNVWMLVPGEQGFYAGSTYRAALGAMFPGVISRALGNVQDTGALAYRDLMGITETNVGFGFALTTEAFLNFGYLGVFVVAAFCGWGLTRLYYVSLVYKNTWLARTYAYPIIVAFLPYGLRTDALGQGKSIIYPVLIMYFLLIFARTGTAYYLSRRRKRDVEYFSMKRGTHV